MGIIDIIDTLADDLVEKMMDARSDSEKASIIGIMDISDFCRRKLRSVPLATQCYVTVMPEAKFNSKKANSDKLMVRVVLLNSDGQFIRAGKNSAYGKIWYCDDVDKNLETLMNGEETIVVQIQELIQKNEMQ